MTETVSCEIVLGDGRPWRGHLPVLRLSWVDSDPLAVAVVVGARPPHPALLRGPLGGAAGRAARGAGGRRAGRRCRPAPPATCRCPGRTSTSRSPCGRVAAVRRDRAGRADPRVPGRDRSRSCRPAGSPGHRRSTPRSRGCWAESDAGNLRRVGPVVDLRAPLRSASASGPDVLARAQPPRTARLPRTAAPTAPSHAASLPHADGVPG
jgi:hypothetical protein